MADLSRLKALLESGVTSAKGAYDSLQKHADEANKGLVDSGASMLEQAGYSPEVAQARSKRIQELGESGGQSALAIENIALNALKAAPTIASKAGELFGLRSKISGAGKAALEEALAKSVAAKAATPASQIEGILGPEVMSRFKVRAPIPNAQMPVQEIPNIPLSKLQEVFRSRNMANMLPEADAAFIKAAQDEANQKALLDSVRKSALSK